MKNGPQKLLIIGLDTFILQSSPQPKIDFSYYEYVPRPICLLICVYEPPTRPPHLFHVVIERSHISTGIWVQGFDSKSVFLSEMDFHLRRKIRQVSIIRPNSLCFLLPPALSKKTMAAPQLTMLVLQIFSSILWIEVGFCFNVSQSRWICKTWF